MKPEIINIANCKQFTTKDSSKIREILSPQNSSLKRQSLAEAVLSIGTATEEHCHPKSEEIYYILEGHGEIVIEGTSANVKQGDGIVLPPGIKHKIYNRGNTDLVFLCICVPPYQHSDTINTEDK